MDLLNDSSLKDRCFFRAAAMFVLCAFAAEVHAGAATFVVTNQGTGAYIIDGQSNAPLRLVRGEVYTFSINASGHPFLLKTIQGSGAGNQYTNGVMGNGTQVGSLIFTVPLDAPNTLFYNCQFHSPMTGTITVVDGNLARIFGDGFE